MEDQLVENMEIDEDNYISEDDDEVNELIREIFGDQESLEEEQEEEEYEDGNEMWNETRMAIQENGFPHHFMEAEAS